MTLQHKTYNIMSETNINSYVVYKLNNVVDLIISNITNKLLALKNITPKTATHQQDIIYIL